MNTFTNRNQRFPVNIPSQLNPGLSRVGDHDPYYDPIQSTNSLSSIENAPSTKPSNPDITTNVPTSKPIWFVNKRYGFMFAEPSLNPEPRKNYFRTRFTPKPDGRNPLYHFGLFEFQRNQPLRPVRSPEEGSEVLLALNDPKRWLGFKKNGERFWIQNPTSQTVWVIRMARLPFFMLQLKGTGDFLYVADNQELSLTSTVEGENGLFRYYFAADTPQSANASGHPNADPRIASLMQNSYSHSSSFVPHSYLNQAVADEKRRSMSSPIIRRSRNNVPSSLGNEVVLKDPRGHDSGSNGAVVIYKGSRDAPDERAGPVNRISSSGPPFRPTSGPPGPPGPPPSVLQNAIAIQDFSNKRLCRTPSKKHLFHLKKGESGIVSDEVAYFHFLCVDFQAKDKVGKPLDLADANEKEIVLKSYNNDAFLSVSKNGFSLTEQNLVNERAIWIFKDLPHSPLAFALTSYANGRYLVANGSHLKAKSTDLTKESSLVLGVPPTLQQAVAQQSMKKPAQSRIIFLMVAASSMAASSAVIQAVINIKRGSNTSIPTTPHRSSDNPTEQHLTAEEVSNTQDIDATPGGKHTDLHGDDLTTSHEPFQPGDHSHAIDHHDLNDINHSFGSDGHLGYTAPDFHDYYHNYQSINEQFFHHDSPYELPGMYDDWHSSSALGHGFSDSTFDHHFF